MSVQKRLFCFMSLTLCCNIIFLSQALADDKKNDLTTIIKKSFNLENKQHEIEADVGIDWLGTIPGFSPWETQLDTSVESLWSNAERNSDETRYQAFNLISTVNQRTPYGLSLNVNYEQLLDIPDVDIFLSTERISANVFISLYNDFLGTNTDKILQSTAKKNKQVFDDKIRIQTCERIANQFFETFLNEQNFTINQEAIKDIEFIQKRLSKNAVTAQDYLSLTIDKAQLDNRLMRSAQQFKNSQLLLSDLTRLPVDEIVNLALNENIKAIIANQDKKFQILERLDLEIDILKARKKLLEINQRNDVSLYAGLRSQKTLVLNEANTNTSNVVGLNFRWNFGNVQVENSMQSLDFEISKRNIQKDHIMSQQKKIAENFKAAIDGQATVLEVMQSASQSADGLQSIARKNFLNGRIGFFEFLTLRNQVNSVKTEYIQALIDFYKITLDQAVYSGDVESTCFMFDKSTG